MTSQKRDRLVAAVTVNVVLLLVILVAVMVYQLVTIFVLKDNTTNLDEEISQIIESTESMEDDIEKYKTIEWLQNHIINNWGIYKDYFTNSGSTGDISIEFDEAYIQIIESTEDMEYDIEYYQTLNGLNDLIIKYGLYKN